jgi:hypothetical protein
VTVPAMTTIYVARSVNLSKWASDVGLSKHVFKLGVTEEPVKALIEKGWAGETDWTLVKSEEAPGLTEDEALERISKKQKMVDPNLYPRIKGAHGIFKVLPASVESHIIVGRALEGGPERVALKLKPADFASYLIKNAVR